MSSQIESSSDSQANQFLLVCGILSSLWYVIINIYVPSKYEGYNLITLTVSELSAIGAPTRRLWLEIVILYPILFAAFGLGIIRKGKGNRRLKVIGVLILAYSAFNLHWPPMHMRGIEPTLTDNLHILWAMITVIFMVVIMGYGAISLGKRFQVYTIASILLLSAFGILTSLEAPNIPIHGPTPWIGLWERINIGIFMIWVVVFAIMLMRKSHILPSR